ncbi:hypothetical protein L0664_17590 [Octadecabacter sp. G9-8]|uniref:Uncharacterized protein n=1 Tax=Octadecabacter dasysiphoniae TaxID=2909341 RepID=A0ABS9D089_9RHOB|nr:hypothetical protein [Octadecabacter dasysiphoniae]MCF2872884.1 hypothetical protein [Octadecabacter dasysiphoniae]
MRSPLHIHTPLAASSGVISADQIEAALLKVAMLVARDPAFAPVFERLEAELTKAKDAELGALDVQRRARALLDHSAMPRIKVARCSKVAPLP